MLALVLRILLVRLNVRCAILPDFPLGMTSKGTVTTMKGKTLLQR